MISTTIALSSITVTGAIRLVAATAGPALYMASTEDQTPSAAPFYDFATTLAPVALDGQTPSFPTVVLPQPLSPSPTFDLTFAADGTLEVAYQVFGGAWNNLHVETIGTSGSTLLYVYSAIDCGLPRFVRDISGRGAAASIPVTTILDSELAALLVAGEKDSEGEPGAISTDLVSAAACVAFADLSAGAPSTLSLIYKTEIKDGPQAPGEVTVGKLALAGFDMGTKTLGTPVPLLPKMPLAEFDIAYQGGCFCLLGTTGRGLPLLAAFDFKGQPIGAGLLPLGDWTSGTRWVTSPTIIADPTSSTPKFDFGFIEMEDDMPVGITVSTTGASSSGVDPKPMDNG